jgi:hypothetical protein
MIDQTEKKNTDNIKEIFEVLKEIIKFIKKYID